MGRVSNKNQHLKKIAQLSVKSRQESIKDKNHEINSANELIDNEIWDTYKLFKFVDLSTWFFESKAIDCYKK